VKYHGERHGLNLNCISMKRSSTNILKRTLLSAIVFCLFSFVISTCIPSSKTKPPAATPAAPLPLTRETYLWAIKPQVNVRERNSEKARILVQLADGDSVKVYENQSGWYRILTADQQPGWIRSDLIGPRPLSIFNRAVHFSDSLRNRDGIELYFDKKLQHKRIYIRFPRSYYSGHNLAESTTRSLAENFQSSVYPGQVTVRVLQPDSQEEAFTLTFPGAANADPLLPVIPFGIIHKVITSSAREIALTIRIGDEIEDKSLLLAARAIAAAYPLTFTRVEVRYIDWQDNCRFWFQEGQEGETYSYSPCQHL
jgi:hypothetical protein